MLLLGIVYVYIVLQTTLHYYDWKQVNKTKFIAHDRSGYLCRLRYVYTVYILERMAGWWDEKVL